MNPIILANNDHLSVDFNETEPLMMLYILPDYYYCSSPSLLLWRVLIRLIMHVNKGQVIAARDRAEREKIISVVQFLFYFYFFWSRVAGV